MAYEEQSYWILTSLAGGQLYSDTFPYEVIIL